MRATSACADCVVTFLSGRESNEATNAWIPPAPGQAFVLDDAEAETLRLLQAAGLAPDLRHASGQS
jgi:hypothetical protein